MVDRPNPLPTTDAGSPRQLAHRGTPGSRRARKKARTRAEMVRAALELFEAEGFESVSIERICAAADVARATFFLHFPSKAALLGEVDRALATELRVRLATPRRSARAELRVLVDGIAERRGAHGGATGALLRQLLSGYRGSELIDLITEVVERGQRRGEFRRNVPAELAALLLLSSCAAARAGALSARSAKTAAEIRNDILHAVLHGMAEPKPRLKWTPGAAPRAR
jgi:AcrR family transcriptional regulator